MDPNAFNPIYGALGDSGSQTNPIYGALGDSGSQTNPIYGTNTASSTQQSDTSGNWWYDFMNLDVATDQFNEFMQNYENPSTASGVLDYLKGHQDDESSKDLLFQYLLGEKSLNDAYSREMAADSTKYQRLVEDLKKAGINPMFALGGAGVGNITSQGSSYNSGYETRRSHKANEDISRASLKEQKRKNNMDFITNILRIAVSAAGIAMLA